MPQVRKGCLIGVVGTFAVFADAGFAIALKTLLSEHDRLVCPPIGCSTAVMPVVMLGISGVVFSLGFLGLLLRPRRG
jgi:hypothetical protein